MRVSLGCVFSIGQASPLIAKSMCRASGSMSSGLHSRSSRGWGYRCSIGTNPALLNPRTAPPPLWPLLPPTHDSEEFEFPLQVRLMYDDKPRAFLEKDILEVDPPVPQLGRNGKATFHIRFRDVSMNFDNRDFCLHVSAVTKASKFYVTPLVSEPMTVRNAPILCQDLSMWSRQGAGVSVRPCVAQRPWDTLVLNLLGPQSHRSEERRLTVSLLGPSSTPAGHTVPPAHPSGEPAAGGVVQGRGGP